MQDRCAATTAKKTQCSRNGSVKRGASYYCAQHAGTSSVKEEKEEPWDRLGLVRPNVDALGTRALRRLRTKLSAPSSGGKGFIYVYYFESERALNYYKVGMTERTVEERIKEWARECGANHVIVLARAYRVERNHKLIERIVHLYLDHVRMYRYPNESYTAYKSVWARSGATIEDGASLKGSTKHDFVARRKQIEWFQVKLHEIERIVESVIHVYG
jgi:Meiotically up-regulated gene 113